MTRVRRGPKARKRRNKILKKVKGFQGGRRTYLRQAMETLRRALAYAYRGRKLRKRDFRKLWIIRISAGAKANGISYSRFMGGLRKAGVELDRKVLADLAVADPSAFAHLVTLAREQD